MPCDLPLELVLSILELAAHSEIDHNRHWVLGLCSLSRACRPTMSRILYYFVVIRAGSDALDRVSRLARLAETPFTHTRVLLVSTKANLGTNSGPLVSSFSHLVYLAGHAFELSKFLNARNPIRPRMVFVTDGWDEEPPNLQPLLEECTHLHMTWSGHTPLNIISRLGAPRLTHVIVDVAHDLPPGPQYQLMEDLLRYAGLRRVLYRTAYTPNSAAADFVAFVRRFAVARQEARIWLDGSTVGHDEQLDNFDDSDIADIQRGRELWLSGQQLYTSVAVRDTS